MSLRLSIHALLLAAAALAAVPAGTLHAAEAAPDTSEYAPRLIDPQSPPPADRTRPPAPAASGSPTPWPAAARTPELRDRPESDGDPAVMNRPAVEDIELQMNADVLRYVAYFTGAGRSTFERWLKRSGRYMELFRSVLQKEGLPPDLVHLVFVESGFNVNARSYAAAVGPWQFMRATSQLFGLHVNQWVDERKDPEKATVAAARYLKHLYGIFGDWPLALASYNAGEGTVMRAIKHQGTTNYWELRLPKQTEEYVPQFMAALAISRDPAKYGFADVELDDPLKFDELAIKGAVDLRSLARLAECSYEELKELNPSARAAVVRGANGITTIRVPEGRSEVVQRNLAAGVELPSVNLTVRHRVRRGETLRAIAEHYSVSAVELARINSLGRGRPLRRGMMLTVPSSFRAPKPEVLAFDDDDPRASTAYVPERRIGLPGKIEGNSVPIERFTHTVKRGETLAGIAGKYRVTVTELRMWNRLTPSTPMRVGTRLRIHSSDDDVASATPKKSPAAKPAPKPQAEKPAAARSEAEPSATRSEPEKSAPEKPALAAPAHSVASTEAPAAPAPAPRISNEPRLHTVSRDETINVVAGKYGITPEQLREWNGLRRNEVLEAGRVLEVSEAVVADARTLDAPAGRPSNQGKPVRYHTVRSGETITEIAGRHDVSVETLRKLNKLRTTRLTTGQKLRLPA
jgi:membrane-bound lytic murein transglycosylase D